MKPINLFLTFVICITIFSCGKSHKALPIIDDSGLTTSTLIESALKEDSQNVDEIINLIDSKISTIIIPASKTYNPIGFNDGWYYFKKYSEFELPENIQVLNGRAGNHIAIVTINRATSKDSLAADLKCVYVGQENGDESDYLATAKPYNFDFCIDGNLLINEKNYSSLKIGSEIILDRSTRQGSILKASRADKITVEVIEGNHKESGLLQHVATEVEFTFIKKII